MTAVKPNSTEYKFANVTIISVACDIFKTVNEFGVAIRGNFYTLLHLG